MDKTWAKTSDELNKEITIINKDIKQKEKEIKDHVNLKMDTKNLLQIIENDLVTAKTKIDKKMVKPHRGFIMYGPPGKNSI